MSRHLFFNYFSFQACFRVLGCFSMKEPWKSLLRPLPAPMTPEEVGTRIFFYSKANPDKRYEILLRPDIKLNGAPFDRSKPTVFITHGFAANGNSSWMLEMKDAYLSRVDGNAMIVDWGPGASKLNYFQVHLTRDLHLLLRFFFSNFDTPCRFRATLELLEVNYRG